MQPAAEKLAHIFILEGITKEMSQLNTVLGAVILYYQLNNSDESLRLLLQTIIKLEETGHALMEIMVEECMHNQIALFQETLNLLPSIKHSVLKKLQHRTTEEQLMFESLSPV